MGLTLRPRVVLVGGPDIDSRLDFMRLLREAGFDVSAVGSSARLQYTFENAGFGFQCYPLNRRMRPWLDPITLWHLYRILRGSGAHIAHTFDTKPSVLGRLAARLAGVPVVIGTLPGLGSLYSNNKTLTRVARWLYERLQRVASSCSDLTIFQNSEDADQLVARRVVRGDRVAVVMGSGIRTDVYSREALEPGAELRGRRELGVPAGHRVVIMVSRLIRSKGVLDFAAAAPLVRSLCPETTFLLVGAEDRDSVECLKADEVAKLHEHITWLGPRRDVVVLLSMSDVFVLPTHYREGVPRVLLEAASMGLPVIAADSEGCRPVVTNGENGFLVPPGNVGELSRRIVELLRDGELRERFGMVSRRRVCEEFDLRVIGTKMCEIYWNTLKRRGVC